jgi:hypothetical protein
MAASLKFEYPDAIPEDERLAYGVGALVIEWGGVESIFYGMLEGQLYT